MSSTSPRVSISSNASSKAAPAAVPAPDAHPQPTKVLHDEHERRIPSHSPSTLASAMASQRQQNNIVSISSPSPSSSSSADTSSSSSCFVLHPGSVTCSTATVEADEATESVEVVMHVKVSKTEHGARQAERD